MGVTHGSSVFDTCPPPEEVDRNPEILLRVFDDFVRHPQIDVEGDDTADLKGYLWDIQTLTAGTATILDALGGVVRLDTTAAADGQGPHIETVGEYFDLSTGLDAWYEARVRVDDIDGGQLGIGMVNTIGSSDHIFDPTDDEIDAACTDYILFQVNDGAGTIEIVSAGDSAATAQTVGTIAAATWVRLGFRVKSNVITAFLNGVAVAEISGAAYIPDDEMGLACGVLYEGAQTKFDVDYVDARQLRV